MYRKIETQKNGEMCVAIERLLDCNCDRRLSIDYSVFVGEYGLNTDMTLLIWSYM